MYFFINEDETMSVNKDPNRNVVFLSELLELLDLL
jgi:hypothetical protein